jgi:hypothetical protein
LNSFPPILLNPHETHETHETHEREMSDAERTDAERKKVIIKGMTTACNVWKDMGFNNALEACQMVLNNLNHDSRFTKIR